MFLILHTYNEHAREIVNINTIRMITFSNDDGGVPAVSLHFDTPGGANLNMSSIKYALAKFSGDGSLLRHCNEGEFIHSLQSATTSPGIYHFPG